MISFLPAAARIAKPWKNGGGSTADVLAEPAGAGMDDFGWRVSIAAIAGSGPFSEFKGVDRSLSLLSGAPLQLLVDEVRFRLDLDNPTLRFSGEARVRADAAGGPHTVLNVMSRRDCFAHTLTRHVLSGRREFALNAAAVHVMVNFSGECRLSGHSQVLRQNDAVLVRDETAITLEASQLAGIILIAVHPA